MQPTAIKTQNPIQLLTFALPAPTFVFLNGALSVASGFEAAEVLVCAPVEMVCSAAMLAVTVVLLDRLLLEAETEEELEGLCVVVKVDI